MTTWSRKRHEIIHEFEVTDAPELQDSKSERRMVIRPRKVTLYQKPGTNVISGACIEGRLIRRDGELGGSRMILVGKKSESWGFPAKPPEWLEKLIAELGLEWQTGRNR